MAREKQPPRIDTSSERQPLTDNPFAKLAPRPVEDAASTPTEPVAAPEAGKPGFQVQRTRKGGFPVFLEKRPNGKNVTVIRNISGDLEGLLSQLKKLCGAGGTVREGAIEIQGDHRERVEAFLRPGRG